MAYAGVIYHHWIADSVSIRMLLREWFLRRYDPSRARRQPLALSQAGYWHLFGPRQGGWGLGRSVWASVRWSNRLKRVRRIPAKAFDDFTAHFRSYPIPTGWVSVLHGWARQHQLTLNDLFLAALAEACHGQLPFKQMPWRQNLALGTIVDLRLYSHEDLSDTFGLFLGFTNVICPPEELADFSALARSIASQNALQKQSNAAQSSLVRIAAGLTAGRFLSRRRLITFYRKRTPYAGGISNVNLTHSWAGQYHPQPLLNYLRVSPTGPMLPLVVTPTTLGEQLHFGLTYRPSIVPDDRVDAIAAAFLGRLSQIVHAHT